MAKLVPTHWKTSARAILASRALCAVLAMMFVLLGGLKASASGFEFVQTIGRAVIMHQDAEQEARMMALEDALYTAALQGGAAATAPRRECPPGANGSSRCGHRVSR